MKGYERFSDEELAKMIVSEKDEIKKTYMIRSLSTDELMLKYAMQLDDYNKSCVTYSLHKLENKIKIIETLQEERWLTAALLEIPSNKYKLKFYYKINNLDYKTRILGSLDANEQEIIDNVEYIKNEKEKALIISKLNSIEAKKSFLNTIKDVNSKALIIMTLDDEKLKLEYIEKVTDKRN